jgi:Flp pilus assembly protein CpaB
MTYRARNILIAVGLAGLAGLLTLFYITSYKHRVDKQHENVTVLVASKNIPAGTLGAQVVAGHMLSTAQVTRKAVVRGIITDKKQVSSQIVTQPIYQGEQVTTQRFGPITEAGIRTQLRGTYRAVQVAGDSNQLLAGTVHAGDHVDVVGVVTLRRGSGADDLTFARVVVRDVIVLRSSGAASGATVKVTQPNGGSGYAILRVTDNQSQKLALVYKKGDYWALELRPSFKDADSPSSVETGWTLLTDGLGPGKISRATGGAG